MYICSITSIWRITAVVLCSFLATQEQQHTSATSDNSIPIRAVYFVGEKGVLASDDLKLHPEVLVVHTMRRFEEAVRSPVALWIDKGAVNLVNSDSAWLHKAPQKDYPIVLVGYNNTLYSFRTQLAGFGLHGPYVDWSSVKLEPGFCVWDAREVRKHLPNGVTTISRYGVVKGFAQTPTVQAILDVTNPLLANPPKAPK